MTRPPSTEDPAVPPASAGESGSIPTNPVEAFSPELLARLGALGPLTAAGAAQRLESGSRPVVDESMSEHLVEIADDMLSLLKRMRDVEEGQKSLLARLDQIQEGWSQSARTIAREVDSLRRDVLGDRRQTALNDVFGELMPLVDRLQTMRHHLHETDDARMIAQLSGVLESLSSCLRRIGCEEFHVTPGTPFDAERMQCLSYLSDGPAGVVLEMTQPGYRCGDFVLRRASIRMAAPQTVANTAPGDDFDE